ncbi:MAG: TonB-dependent receptor [Bacteroidales bacterium]
MIKKIIPLFFLFTLLINAGIAQQGFLRGTVTDARTGETLIGVTLFAEGTTIGTTTDFDGKYNLPVDPGTYNIRVSYISYQTQNFTEVLINPGEVNILNIKMKSVTTELQQVVISAKARHNNEAALLIMQKKSASMLDGISAHQISRLGDDNAASALQRVTGVSVQNDKYIYVRGLGDRYTKITMNRADIPALDPEKNTVQMDIFPSNIIENIVVHKTFTPDLPGESTGGHVDIVTMDFPEKFTLQVSASLGYNPQANRNDEFLTYEGGNTDWLGLDDGTRDVPARAKKALDANGNTLYPTTFNAAESYDISNSFNTVMEPETMRSGLDQSYKFSVGNQTPLFSKTLGYNFALGYSKGFEFHDDGEYGLYQEGIIEDPWKIFDTVSYGKEKVNVSGLANLNMKLNNNNKIGFRYFRNQNGTKTALSRSGHFYYEDRDDYDRSLGFMERILNSYQIHGKHVFPAANDLVADWILSYIDMDQNEPDLRFFENLVGDNTWEIKTNDQPARFYRKMNEANLNARLDLELPATIMGSNSKIKFGGIYSYKNRDLEETKFELNVQNSLYDKHMTIDRFLDQYIIYDVPPNTLEEYPAGRLGWYYLADQNQDKNNSYEAAQSVFAGYAMIDWPVVDRLRFIAGLRLEYTDLRVNNLVGTADTKYKSGGYRKTDPLPSLNLIYNVNDEMNFRLAGSQTIARPSFREIGTNYYDYKLGIFVVGNQDLKRSRITNVDLRYEWFFNREEKIAITGFYKHFTDPIEQQLSPETQNFEIKYINVDKARLYGFEFEFRKDLDFINFLRSFHLAGNFTYIKSAVKIPPKELRKIRLADPGRSDTRPMLLQAPYVINASLGYEHDNLGLESTLAFNVSGEKLFIITKGSTPYIYEQPYPSLNFNISKSITKNFIIELSAGNILDSEYQAVHHYPGSDRNYITYSTGRSYKVGLKYMVH